MARPTILTPELQEQILRYAREGLFITTVAGFVEVHRDTIYGWLQKGEAEAPPDEHGVYVEFARKFRRAEAEAERRSVLVVRRGGKRAKGNAWWLERRWPDRYGRRLRAELTGADGGPIATTSAVAVYLPAEREDDD